MKKIATLAIIAALAISNLVMIEKSFAYMCTQWCLDGQCTTSCW